MFLPRKFAPVVFAVLQSGLTTGIATAFATFRYDGLSPDALWFWLSSWIVSWSAILPLVVMLAPVLQKVVAACVRDEL